MWNGKLIQYISNLKTALEFPVRWENLICVNLLYCYCTIICICSQIGHKGGFTEVNPEHVYWFYLMPLYNNSNSFLKKIPCWGTKAVYLLELQIPFIFRGDPSQQFMAFFLPECSTKYLQNWIKKVTPLGTLQELLKNLV